MDAVNCVLIVILHILEVYSYFIWFVCRILYQLFIQLVENPVIEDSPETPLKLGFLDEGICLSDEITRNILHLQSIINCENTNEQVKQNAACELSKSMLLLKGKLKTFLDLCMVALGERDPFESDEPVNVTDLDGYHSLLAIEIDKHREVMNEILNPTIKPDPVKCVIKATLKDKPKLVQVQKAVIDERNRKYMERMKKLREIRCKPGKENLK